MNENAFRLTIPNLINQSAHKIRNVCERTWNDIVMDVLHTNQGQQNVVWPKLALKMFKNKQEAATIFLDFFLPAMEWAGFDKNRILMMKSFLLEHFSPFSWASDLIIKRQFCSAYKVFQESGIPHLTAAAASYYFHAICLNSEKPRIALVFDNNVVKALWGCQSSGLNKSLSADQDVWRAFLFESGIVINPGNIKVDWNLRGYLSYLRLLQSWANTLECTPVQIQMWLSSNSRMLWEMRDAEIEAKNHGNARDILDI